MRFLELFFVISPSETKNQYKLRYKIMDLTGKVIAILPASSGVSQRTGNPWMSQDYVIEVPGQYPKKCLFRIFGEDRIKQFNIQMGEDIPFSSILMRTNLMAVGLTTSVPTTFCAELPFLPQPQVSPWPHHSLPSRLWAVLMPLRRSLLLKSL